MGDKNGRGGKGVTYTSNAHSVHCTHKTICRALHRMFGGVAAAAVFPFQMQRRTMRIQQQTVNEQWPKRNLHTPFRSPRLALCRIC